MKKFMSAILAVIMMFSIAIPVFAAEETTKNVDNTFNNFEPAPGKKAPDNWYDPYCYEADGRINKYCLNTSEGNVARYCPEYKRIFTIAPMGRTAVNDKVIAYYPYYTNCSGWVIKDAFGEIKTIDDFEQHYCPYCGKYEIASYINEDQSKSESIISTHSLISSVIYGVHCDKCNSFVASASFAGSKYSSTPFEFYSRYDNSFDSCNDVININEAKLYRFLTDEQKNAEYSFIFTETEKDFGDGKDGNVSDLKTDKNGYYNEWDSPDNPYQKLTFWQKIAKFFAKIALWFKNLFK